MLNFSEVWDNLQKSFFPTTSSLFGKIINIILFPMKVMFFILALLCYYCMLPLFLIIQLWEWLKELLKDLLKNIFYKMNKKYLTPIIILLFVSVCIIEKFGVENPNSIIAKREFNFKGYVYAFPNKKYDKNYHLKADILKDGSRYYVQRIYFYNGGYIEFDYDKELSISKDGKMTCGYYEKENKEWCFRFYGDLVGSR